MKKLLTGLSCLLLLFSSRIAYCQTVEEKERIYKFANVLFESQEFYRAITEYRRFIEYFPDDYRINDAYVKIAESYFYGERYTEAISWSRKMLEATMQPEFLVRARILAGDSYFKLGNYKSAMENYSAVLEPGEIDRHYLDLSHMKLGLCLLYEENWRDASSEFAKVNANSSYFEKAQLFSKNALQGSNLKRKSRSLAGVLSVIPGLGYVYTGNYQTGIASFVVNSLLIWGTYNSFSKGNKGVGFTLGFFGFGFYSGNIYGSINSAVKYNERQKADFLDGFRQ
ncbi:tetratricopeptide repeat protein [bacterium]|nr:tetratricopeptide repeat protein [bacterium]